MKRPKRPLGRRLRRNPHAKALANPLFRPRAEKKPDTYQRKSKHPKKESEEPE
jgi:stalled ribosome alternative rescue factor ArfA